ncbi:MAG: InlB B-repeat-containing protein, partial [Oscillospiraceae bacterium]|nr:InlB B-repeat-containing protein [Oscillospiraceae bacterium]
MKTKFRSVLTLLLALVLTVGQTGPALAADTAAVMKLSKVEGTSAVANASGRELTIRDDMRLYSGYTVKTSAASYAWINLDDTKLVKLDASTEVEIRKSGQNLEVLLKCGNIYSDVSKPLESSETLNIRTSTAVVGIRGTKFTVGLSEYEKEGAGQMASGRQKTLVSVTEGTVSLTAPASTHSSSSAADAAPDFQTTFVSAGQTAAVTPQLDSGTPANQSPSYQMDVTTAQAPDIPGFAQVELTKDGDYTVGNGEEAFTLTQAGAQAQQAAEERAAQEALDAALAALQAENAAVSDDAGPQNTDPVWEDSGSDAAKPSAPSTTPSTPGTSTTPNTPSVPNTPNVPDVPSTPSGPAPVVPDNPTIPEDPTNPFFTVAFDANGGTLTGPETVETSGVLTLPSVPSRDGFEFMGWFTAAEGGTEVTEGTAVTESMTLYAHWDAIQFLVTYDQNGGDTAASPSSQTFYTGTMLTEPTSPVRTGYQFGGWYTDAECTDGNGWDFGQDAAPSNNFTLYAKWTLITYTVAFNLNYTNAPSPTEVLCAYNTALEEPENPDRMDYQFQGWYKDARCTDKWDFTTDKITEDTILYAGWAIIYDVTFDLNYAGAPDAVTESFAAGSIAAPPAGNPTRAGYGFGGWYQDAACTIAWDINRDVVRAPMTLYAWWIGETETLTLTGDSGSDAQKFEAILYSEACSEITVSPGSASGADTLTISAFKLRAGQTLTIDENVTVKGTITDVRGDLVVNGTVSGGVSVEGQGTLTMGRTGRITAGNNPYALRVAGTDSAARSTPCVQIDAGGVINGEKNTALHIVSGTVEGGALKASRLQDTLVVDGDATDWAVSGLCDSDTPPEAYMGDFADGLYALNWAGELDYVASSFNSASGAFGTHL